ncbi:hypothetical protein HAX54_016510 [Datura stramonium]|uniref:Uncharacterized protein n=1 Tax=Datura stramonium TaxID=4076 RepID=A0ABS8S2C7_DATST|nr:hypothetical protein [Datura stramonium]
MALVHIGVAHSDKYDIEIFPMDWAWVPLRLGHLHIEPRNEERHERKAYHSDCEASILDSGGLGRIEPWERPTGYHLLLWLDLSIFSLPCLTAPLPLKRGLKAYLIIRERFGTQPTLLIGVFAQPRLGSLDRSLPLKNVAISKIK